MNLKYMKNMELLNINNLQAKLNEKRLAQIVNDQSFTVHEFMEHSGLSISTFKRRVTDGELVRVEIGRYTYKDGTGIEILEKESSDIPFLIKMIRELLNELEKKCK